MSKKQRRSTEERLLLQKQYIDKAQQIVEQIQSLNNELQWLHFDSGFVNAMDMIGFSIGQGAIALGLKDVKERLTQVEKQLRQERKGSK